MPAERGLDVGVASMGSSAGAVAGWRGVARAPSLAALSAGVLLLVVVVAILPLNYAAHQLLGSIFPLAFAPGFGIVGLVVLVRQPRNAIGWLLLGIALFVSSSFDVESYAYLIYHQGHHGLPLPRIAVALAPCWYPGLVLLPLTILLFPDGRLPSRRWRWPLRAYIAVAAVLLATVAWLDAPSLYARHIHVDSSGQLRAIDYPTGWESRIEHACLLGFVIFCVAAVGGQVLAFRRSTGIQHQQLKSLLTGGAVCVCGLLVSIFGGGLSGPFWAFVSNFSFLAIVALPIGIGVGILRYRLYEIDRLVSRTLTYAVLTALLAGVYLGLVALISDALPFSSPVAVAASTLTAAALFSPLRRRVQHIVDRRFNRARYDAEATVAAFSPACATRSTSTRRAVSCSTSSTARSRPRT